MYSEEYIADFALIGNVDAGEVLRQLVSAMKEQVLVQSMGYRQVDGEGVHYAKTSPRKPGGVNPEYRLGVTMDTMKDAMRTRGASEEEIQEALDRTEAEFRACQEKALGKEFFFSAALLERESYMATVPMQEGDLFRGGALQQWAGPLPGGAFHGWRRL